MADETMTEDVFMAHMERAVRRSQEIWPDDWRNHHTFYDGEVARLLDTLRQAADEPRALVRAHDWDEDDRMSGLFVLANHELARARAKHGPMHSHHEAYAVLLEELDEVWDEVKRQTPDPQRIIAELVQVAAMCARWAEDVCGALPPTDERGR